MLYDKDNNPIPGGYQQNEVDVDLADLVQKLSEEEKNYISGFLENDPLDNSYKKGLIVYLIITITLLLWPFDFIFSPPKNGTAWIQKTNGIEFLKAGKIISTSPAESLYDQMLSGSGFSLEVWAAPENTEQSGPARIVSYSLDHRQRNFTLGQSQQNLIVRLRTSETDKNGIYPHMVVDNVFHSTNPYHLTVTYDFSRQRIYVNGQIRAEKTTLGGDFSNWDPSHYLLLGNEVTGERPWAGELFYVSIYNRVLEPHEVHHNFMTGASWEPDFQPKTDLISSGLVVRYFFDEHTGDIIKDSSGNVRPLDLYIPEKLNPSKKQLLTFSFLQFANIQDTILNIILFIPFGFLLSGAVQKKQYSLVNTFFIVLIIGTLFTISIESIQYFLLTRTSSLIDVMNNILGTIVGVILFRSWKKLLRSQGQQLQ